MVSRADIKGIYEGLKAGTACGLVAFAISVAVTRTYEFVSDFVSEKYPRFDRFGGGGRYLPREPPGEGDDD